MKTLFALGFLLLTQVSYAQNALPKKCQNLANKIATEAITQGYFGGAQTKSFFAQTYLNSYMNKENRQQEDYTFVYPTVIVGARALIFVNFVVQGQNTCLMTGLNLKIESTK